MASDLNRLQKSLPACSLQHTGNSQHRAASEDRVRARKAAAQYLEWQLLLRARYQAEKQRRRNAHAVATVMLRCFPRQISAIASYIITLGT